MMIQKQELSLTTVRAAAIAVSLVLAFINTSAAASRKDTGAVLAANAHFYSALNAMFTGDLVAMKTVWSHAGDVTYMGPTGKFDHGWSAVLKDWKGQAALKLGGRVKPVDIHLLVGKKLAVVADYEQGENTNAQGKIEHLRLRATNVFRKEGHEWKMVGHHTDLLPYLAK